MGDDDTFIKNLIEYAVTCNENIIEDVFNLPPDLEDTLDPFISFAEPYNGSTDNHLKEPSVEVTGPEDASNVVSGEDEELMEIESAWTLSNNLVASADPQTFSEKSPSSTWAEILLIVNGSSDPLPQHQTNPCKPSVSSSIITTWTLDVDIDDYLCLHPSPHLRPTSHQRPSHPQSGIPGPWTSTSTATSCIHACLRLTLRLVSSPFPLGTTQMETSL